MLASVWAMMLAVCCCDWRCSAVRSGRWRSCASPSPSSARWGCRPKACAQGSRIGEPARSQSVRRASIAMMAAHLVVPAAAGSPSRDCRGVRPAASGRRSQVSQCPFRVGTRSRRRSALRRPNSTGRFRAASSADWLAGSDPKPPVSLPGNCPTLGPASCGLGVYEAAIRGHRDPAITGCWRRSASRHLCLTERLFASGTLLLHRLSGYRCFEVPVNGARAPEQHGRHGQPTKSMLVLNLGTARA
jgi:hypothetical protein